MKIDSDARHVLKTAKLYGWVCEEESNEALTLRHPNVETSVLVPKRAAGQNRGRLQRAETLIRRAPQPTKGITMKIEFGPEEIRESAIITPSGARTVFSPAWQEPVPRTVVVKDHTPSTLTTLPKSAPEDVKGVPMRPTMTISETTRVEVPSVVSVKPFVAKRSMTNSGGKVYSSVATLEVIYSDGSVAYRCSECEFERPQMSSIRGHRSVHGATTGASPKSYIDPAIRWDPNPRQEATITRLANEIRLAMETGITEPGDMARSIIGLRVRETQSETEAIQPLTPEETLAQIRVLLDGGMTTIMEVEIARLNALLDEAAAANVQLRNSEYKASQNEEKLKVRQASMDVRFANMMAVIELAADLKDGDS